MTHRDNRQLDLFGVTDSPLWSATPLTVTENPYLPEPAREPADQPALPTFAPPPPANPEPIRLCDTIDGAAHHLRYSVETMRLNYRDPNGRRKPYPYVTRTWQQHKLDDYQGADTIEQARANHAARVAWCREKVADQPKPEPEPEPEPAKPNPWEQRQAQRKAGLEAAAEAKAAEAAASWERSGKMASVIPFGQPILVGHHSEKADRRYRDRIHRTMERASEQRTEANDLARRAAAVGKGGISSDDPDAPDKLRAHLLKREEIQARMVLTNKLIRSGDRAGLAALGLSEATIDRFMTERPYPSAPLGFQGWELSNNNAEIRRLKTRIAELERQQERAAEQPDPVATEHDGWTVTEDAVDNRIAIAFDERQPSTVTAILKGHGFRWSPTRGAWVRQLNNGARFAAEQVAAAIARLDQ